MGAPFETAQMVFLEFAILRLRDRLDETAGTMRAQHTDLE